MFMCLSKAFTLARIFRLFRQLIKTCEFVFTAFVKSESGPSWKISSYGVCCCFACSTIKIKIIKFYWLSLNADLVKKTATMGLEPTIFCSVGRRVIHYATRLIVPTSILTPFLTTFITLLYNHHSSISLYLTTNILIKGSQSSNLICAVRPIQLSIVLHRFTNHTITYLF